MKFKVGDKVIYTRDNFSGPTKKLRILEVYRKIGTPVYKVGFIGYPGFFNALEEDLIFMGNN